MPAFTEVFIWPKIPNHKRLIAKVLTNGLTNTFFYKRINLRKATRSETARRQKKEVPSDNPDKGKEPAKKKQKRNQGKAIKQKQKKQKQGAPKKDDFPKEEKTKPEQEVPTADDQLVLANCSDLQPGVYNGRKLTLTDPGIEKIGKQDVVVVDPGRKAHTLLYVREKPLTRDVRSYRLDGQIADRRRKRIQKENEAGQERKFFTSKQWQHWSGSAKNRKTLLKL